MYKIIKLLLIILIGIFTLIFLFVLKTMFFNFEERNESYYVITSVKNFQNKVLKLKYEWEYYGDLIINLNEIDEDLYLKKIKIIYKNALIGEIYVNKKKKKTEYDEKFSYSIKEKLKEILGNENEKYNITDSDEWYGKFILTLEIEDKNKSKYFIEDNVTIRFKKRGIYHRSIIDYF